MPRPPPFRSTRGEAIRSGSPTTEGAQWSESSSSTSRNPIRLATSSTPSSAGSSAAGPSATGRCSARRWASRSSPITPSGSSPTWTRSRRRRVRRSSWRRARTRWRWAVSSTSTSRRSRDMTVEAPRSQPAALAAIGDTPVARLEALVEPGMAEVWVKVEAANPTGSYKDRMALAMIEGAERSGRLEPGQTVVEYTGGSTGSSLALVCSIKGYPLRIVSSDAYAPEKIKTMRAFGAEVELLPSPEGITPSLVPRLRARAAEVAAEIGGFQTDQFNNRDMVDGYEAIGEELLG